MNLWQIKTSEIARIKSFGFKNTETKELWEERLQSQGLVVGARIELVQQVPLGGPKLFLSERGSVAIDQWTAEQIEIRLLEPEMS